MLTPLVRLIRLPSGRRVGCAVVSRPLTLSWNLRGPNVLKSMSSLYVPATLSVIDMSCLPSGVGTTLTLELSVKPAGHHTRDGHHTRAAYIQNMLLSDTCAHSHESLYSKADLALMGFTCMRRHYPSNYRCQQKTTAPWLTPVAPRRVSHNDFGAETWVPNSGNCILPVCRNAL